MKKIISVALSSLGFLLLCSFTELLTRNILFDFILTLILGIAVLIISGIIALFSGARVALNAVCFILSSAAFGVLLRAWYINRGFKNSAVTMLLISLCAALYLFLFALISQLKPFSNSRRAYVILALVYGALSGVAYLVVMLTTKTTFVSTFGYFMIVELGFIFALSFETNNRRELFRNLTLSTYSIFGVALGILAVAVIALAIGEGGDCDCECDCVDGCDCIDGCDCLGECVPDSAKSNKKRKK